MNAPSVNSRFENPEAEIDLLKCVMVDAPVALAALRKHPGIDAYFGNLQHAEIFRAVARLTETQKPIVPLEIHSAISGASVDCEFLTALFSQAQSYSASGADHFADKLQETYLLRSQRDEHRRAIHALENGDDDTAAFSAKAALDFAGGIIHDDGLPAIEDAATLASLNLPKPTELIYGLLHRGSKLVLGGSSKSFKTWSLIDLGLSVANGEPFWSMKTAKGRVLYLNFEVQSVFFSDRVKAVATAKGIELQPGKLDVWNLRGHAADFRSIIPKIERKIKTEGYSLLILDPLYKLLGDAEENNARDMSAMMNEIERLCCSSGAAVAFGSHFAKGNASAKESIDRISGSGVFARDPDSILTLTKHEEDECFAVEATLRNFKPLSPFVVQWQYPLMRRVDLDPAKLKQAGGRKAEHTPDNIIPFIAEKPLSTAEWQKVAKNEEGISERTFYRLHASLKTTGKIEQKGGKWTLLP
jgi:hypothetical protein